MSKIQRFIEMWHRHYQDKPLPICNEMNPSGNFIYRLNGEHIGFAFGQSGRATQCYWVEDLRKYKISIPDASNQYVAKEKLDSLISGS